MGEKKEIARKKEHLTHLSEGIVGAISVLINVVEGNLGSTHGVGLIGTGKVNDATVRASRGGSKGIQGAKGGGWVK